ncbi:dTDP-4-dehydrorhamnose [Synechococcus phage S-CRES1]|nr:dTDP-4-dehydrorhamnose [Synechococcus phage S-CRES1]
MERAFRNLQGAGLWCQVNKPVRLAPVGTDELKESGAEQYSIVVCLLVVQIELFFTVSIRRANSRPVMANEVESVTVRDSNI